MQAIQTFFLILLASLASIAQAREAIEATGKIVRIHDASGGGVAIKRDGVQLPVVFANHLLFDGDEIRAFGTSRADVRDFLSHKDVVVSAATGPLRISGVRQRQWSSGAESFLATLAHLFEREPSPIVIFILTRDSEVFSLRMLPALSNSLQKVIPGRPDQPILWLNAPGKVVAMSTSVTETFPPTTMPSASISTMVLPVDVTVSGAVGPVIRWHIVAGDRPPPPPWRSDYPSKAETAERVAASAWILTSGPVDWRLFALGEIRDLSLVEPTADRLWRAVRSGDWLSEP